jgi:predicted small secreted protein
LNLDKVFNIAALIVGLAIVATLVASPNTVKIVTGVGNTFSNSIKAAKH